MPLGERIRAMGLFPKIPDVEEIRQEVEEKFQLMLGHLESIDRNTKSMLDELRTQRGAPQ